ncbi:peroxin 6 isoform X2 [Carex rostrata]
MVEMRRKPLILASTRAILDSVLSPSESLDETELDDSAQNRRCLEICESIKLTAGVLRFDEITDASCSDEFSELSSFVCASTSVLRQLETVTGSLVLIKNTETNVGRIAKIIILDPTGQNAEELDSTLDPPSHRVMGVLPSHTYPKKNNFILNNAEEVGFISPLLAFNLGLHTSCLKLLLTEEDNLFKYFESNGEAIEGESMTQNNLSLKIEVAPWPNLPKYASHLRVSFVKIPECGMLASLKGNSPIEMSDYQNMIDSALNEFFKVDRLLTKGDVFCVRKIWSCGSEMCIVCSGKSAKGRANDLIYFKVTSMEPSDEPVLRANSSQTALVLGGAAPSAILPYNLLHSSLDQIPLQGETVKTLSSVIAPAICSSDLSSRFRVALFLYGPSGCGKRTVVRYIAQHTGLHVVEYSCHDMLTSSEKGASVALAAAFKAAHRFSPCIMLLRHFEAFANLSSNEGPQSDQAGVTMEISSIIREYTEPLSRDDELHTNGTFLVQPEHSSQHQVILVASADTAEGLHPAIRRCFSHEISMESLTEEKRSTMITQKLTAFIKITNQRINPELIKEATAQTSGFMPRDIDALFADVAANFVHEAFINNEKSSENEAIGSDKEDSLSKEDFLKALERSKKRNASALGAPKVPNVKWEDVGGLEDVKKSILDTVQLPLMHKHLFSSGLRKRSGVLLYGPPGTGKTLLAKAVATECSLNFLSVKGPELINMYIGESEKNVRDIFQKARTARPCVIFFDELDSLAPARGAAGDSGGVMDRVVSQMLAEIDGLNDSSQDLFIIGASNRPDLIDPALLRPGRFDKLLYVGVNTDPSYRERVLQALTRKFKLHEDVSLFEVAKRCPPNFTGADMYALCADAWFHAAKRKVSEQNMDSPACKDENDLVVVGFDDFVKVLTEISPSLSLSEIAKYERLREKFEGPSKRV